MWALPLCCDPAVLERSGKVWIGAEFGEACGVLDENGRPPPSHRALFGETTRYGEAIVP
jgi:hypothetical protein